MKNIAKSLSTAFIASAFLLVLVGCPNGDTPQKTDPVIPVPYQGTYQLTGFNDTFTLKSDGTATYKFEDQTGSFAGITLEKGGKIVTQNNTSQGIEIGSWVYVRLGKSDQGIDAGRIGMVLSIVSEGAGVSLHTMTLGSEASSDFFEGLSETIKATPEPSFAGMPHQSVLYFIGNKE